MSEPRKNRPRPRTPRLMKPLLRCVKCNRYVEVDQLERRGLSFQCKDGCNPAVF